MCGLFTQKNATCVLHDVDPLKYDKIMRDMAGTKAEYRKAMPFLNIFSEDPTKIERAEVDDRFDALQREVVDLSKSLDAALRREDSVLRGFTKK